MDEVDRSILPRHRPRYIEVRRAQSLEPPGR